LTAAFYTINGCMVLALAACASLCRRRVPTRLLAGLLAAAVISVLITDCS